MARFVQSMSQGSNIRKTAMLLYLHVPFCRRKCNYCAFYSEPLVQGVEAVSEVFQSNNYSQQIQIWLDNLLLEMAQWSDLLDRPAVETVFFGGGTPSLLPADVIALILEKTSCYFKLSPTAEISIEANPESMDPNKARQLVRTGINRVSLGVQSMDDRNLEFLGRVHTGLDVHRAFNNLRSAQVRNINLDLIWGLPGQSITAWLETVQKVIKFEPEHISIYGLNLEENTPFLDWYEQGIFQLPREREQAKMYMRGSEILEESGLLQYEVSNFARMGYQCRHNLGYWEGEDYLGLGPSATSTIKGRRFTNPPNLSQWADMVSQNTVQRSLEVLSSLDRVLELLMLRLRTTRGLRVKAYRELTGRTFMDDHRLLITALHQNGLLKIKNGYLRLTRNGMLVSNSILERFFQSTRNRLSNIQLPGLQPLESEGPQPILEGKA